MEAVRSDGGRDGGREVRWSVRSDGDGCREVRWSVRREGPGRGARTEMDTTAQSLEARAH